MQYVTVCLVALLASTLTFFSGFGVGTILFAAFVLFFPADAALAMTAVVHVTNNLLKAILVGKAARRDVVIPFGVPAIFAALAGAWTLTLLADLRPAGFYELAGRTFAIDPLKVVMAVLMAFFAVWEVIPATRSITVPARWLPLGGILSGFFGGLSGHQGAFRTVFLLRLGLTKQAFIATGVFIAILIDMARLPVYIGHLRRLDWAESGPLIASAIVAAAVGSFVGRALLPVVTLAGVRWIVAALLMQIAIGLALGLI